MKIEPDVRRLLIYRLGSLGDTLLALPAFHLVRRTFPRAEITLLTHVPEEQKAPSLIRILENTNLFEDVIPYPLRLRSLSQVAALRNEIAARGFDLAIHLAESRGRLKSLRDYLFFRLCGIRRFVGIPWRRRDLRCLPAAQGYEWEAERLIRRLRTLGEADLNEPHWWDLGFTETEREGAHRRLQKLDVPFLAVSLGTKADAKDWTEPNWVALLSHLDELLPKIGLVLFGSADEWERSERCARQWSGPKLNLCGLTSPRESGAILEKAMLFVGHDSGPMHLAATVGTSCVSIFSARSLPGQWFPRGPNHTVIYHQTDCFGCGLEVCTRERKKCILSITVEEVVQTVRKHLHSLPGAKARAEKPSAAGLLA